MHWNVIGHAPQRAHLEALVLRDALPHALLLAGPEGVGKHMIARDLAQALIGETLSVENSPDVLQIAPLRDEESGKLKDISVEVIREQLRPWAYLRPLHSAYRIALIDMPERMTDEAANTLLKVLEEPPVYVRFLLTTAYPNAVLPTILSRCESLRFDALTDEDMAHVLEGMKISSSDRTLLAVVAAGRPGMAHNLLSNKRLPEVAKAVEALDAALAAGIAERLLLARDIAELDDPAEVCEWWIAWLRAHLASQPQRTPLMHALLECHDLLRAPQFNRRLALERCLLAS